MNIAVLHNDLEYSPPPPYIFEKKGGQLSGRTIARTSHSSLRMFHDMLNKVELLVARLADGEVFALPEPADSPPLTRTVGLDNVERRSNLISSVRFVDSIAPR
jgi:hypothetical protein